MNFSDISVIKLILAGWLSFALVGCFSGQDSSGQGNSANNMSEPKTSESSSTEIVDLTARFDAARQRMVDEQLAGRDITNRSVLAAMRRVPRHLFVPSRLQSAAYEDHPLSIGDDQTISQPYIVALMTELADPQPSEKALDIGTGSGYQAAVLSEVCDRVYSIEIIERLATEARERLKRLEYSNVEVRCGDGYEGWSEHAPFDVIIVAAAPDHVPQALVDQLAPGGRLVIPVGSYSQQLKLIERTKDGTIQTRSIAPVAFVPMTGKAK
jgi:protein-L-isoaspartate(D-aspartate) O-methyltransferase